jgi:MYXO-CTERM domain-containing protein
VGFPRLTNAVFLHRCVVLCAALAGLLEGASAAAQPSSQSPSSRYFDRGRWWEVTRQQDGALDITSGSERFPARIGTERVLVTVRGALDPAQEGLVIDEVLSERARIWAVRSTRGEDVLALAARLAPLVQRGVLASAMPDLALSHWTDAISIPPNDPRYGGQWFFQTIHIEDAWRHQDGDPSVAVAVIDDGCDLTHPDLVPHLRQGYDALNDLPDPTFTPMTMGNNHGTSCAGLVAAATDNGTDVAGTCAECSLRCVRLLGADGTLIPISTDVRAFDFVMMQADTAVASNSWGFTSGAPAPGPLVDAITATMTMGHGGLGTVVVFAAGNDAAVIGPLELQAIPGVITVGAINEFDEAASFSNRGDSVALVAPTGTLTTDIAGADGEDPGDTTARFGGTSSACPIVAGVLGLMASQRPDMTAAQLREAVIATVRPAPFAVPDAMGHDPLYGYGIVDPAAALARIDPAGVPDAGPRDGGAVDAGASDAGASDAGSIDGGSAPAPSSRCGCGVVGAHHGSLGATLALALIAMVIARRRRAAALALVLAGCAADPAIGASEAALRPDTPGTTELPPTYAATDAVESIVSPGGQFRIHFTRTGGNAVNPLDGDGNGTPDYVDYVAQQYDEVLAYYTGLGFRAPPSDLAVPTDNGGDGLFDVYLLDFSVTGGGADGSYRRETCTAGMGCTGYMLQENDFTGFGYPSARYGARLLASHEFFHAVQAAYDGTLGTQGSTLSESTAVWASERFDPNQRDVEGFAPYFLMRPDRALGVDPIGPVQDYAYGAAIVWEYYTTRYDDQLVVTFWHDLATSHATTTNWLDTLDALLMRDHATSFHDTYVDFGEWLMFTGSRYDPAHGPRHGDRFPEVTAMDLTTLPYTTMPTQRIFASSMRFFTVPRSSVSVRLGGPGASQVSVVAAAFSGTRFVSDARGVGMVDLRESAGDSAIIALVDGRTSGTSSVVSICVAAQASDCTAMSDAGAPDAGGIDDGGGLADASMTPMPASSGCSCRAGGATHTPAGAWLLALALVAMITRRRTRR